MKFYIVIACETSSTAEPSSADLNTIACAAGTQMGRDVRAGEATGPSGIAVKWLAQAAGPGGGPPDPT